MFQTSQLAGVIEAPTLRLAFFDDYPFERGHHPDLSMGLSSAAGARVYCPPSFLEGRADTRTFHHFAVTGAADGSPAVTRQNLRVAYEDAAQAGCDVLVNLFIDENWDSFPLERGAMRLAHMLHRPAELTGEFGGMNAVKLGDAVATVQALASEDLFVVHTTLGELQAKQWLPAEKVAHIGWPAAAAADVRRRFGAPWAHSDEEPYVLLLGEALEYKGIHCLLEAVSGGPRLRIAGNLAVGDTEWLTRAYPKARVTWEPGWVTPGRMHELLQGAAVVAFPYLEEFAWHGGVSAALVQALCCSKPVVVSTALAGQVPDAASCQVVPQAANEVAKALGRVLSDPAGWHEAAQGLEPYVLRRHTYEGHLEQLAERMAR